MKRLRLRPLIAAALLSLSLFLPAYGKGWEAVKGDKIVGQHVISEQELEIKVGGGIIYVSSTKHVNIKIFTILGSRIADDTLAPGTYQFAVPAHGVYIVKAGDMTCKVAV